MRTYRNIFFMSVIVTAVMFFIDRKSLLITQASVGSYFIAAVIYVVAIFAIASAMYFLYMLIKKMFRKRSN